MELRMHELSDAAKRILDLSTAALALVTAVSLNEVATVITIAAGLMSIACGAVRLLEWNERRRSKPAS